MKEKNGGRKKLKKCIEKISVLATAVAKRRRTETQIVNYWSALPRARNAQTNASPRNGQQISQNPSRDFVQNELEFQPKGTAN